MFKLKIKIFSIIATFSNIKHYYHTVFDTICQSYINAKEMLAMLREQHPAGTKVELVHMDDPYTKLTAGDKGKVKHSDDMGTIHISWDCGSSFGAVYGVDVITKT